MDLSFLNDKNLVMKKIKSKIFNFWNDYFIFIFFIFSIIILAPAFYLWYQSTYRSEWNNEQKDQYKRSQSKRVELKELEFNKVIENIEARKKTFESDSGETKDIFLPYPGDSENNQQ